MVFRMFCFYKVMFCIFWYSNLRFWFDGLIVIIKNFNILSFWAEYSVVETSHIFVEQVKNYKFMALYEGFYQSLGQVFLFVRNFLWKTAAPPHHNQSIFAFRKQSAMCHVFFGVHALRFSACRLWDGVTRF